MWNNDWGTGGNQFGQSWSSGQQWSSPQQWTGPYWQGNPGFGQFTPGWQGYGQGFGQGFGGGYAPGWQGWQGGMGMGMGFNPYWGGNVPTTAGYGLGGLRRWGGTYTPQYTSTGLPTDEEIEEMIYDALDDDPMIPWDAEIEVTVDAGEVTLSGTVPNKRIKHAAGDDAWWISGVTDVHNEIKVSGRHKGHATHGPKETEGKTTQPSGMRRGR